MKAVLHVHVQAEILNRYDMLQESLREKTAQLAAKRLFDILIASAIDYFVSALSAINYNPDQINLARARVIQQ
jgi:hypothetical protein